MTDAFATLGLPRRAALDEESFKRAYAARSRAAHPDHGGGEDEAARVNAAHETLRSPEKRLKHLLDLAAPADARAWRTVQLDDGMMSLFSVLGGALEASGKFLSRKRAAQSAIAKALLSNEEMGHREALERIALEIERRKQEIAGELPELDAGLEQGDVSAWHRLAATQARLAYLVKWQAQTRERLLELM